MIEILALPSLNLLILKKKFGGKYCPLLPMTVQERKGTTKTIVHERRCCRNKLYL